MARPLRQFSVGELYHLIVRGNNRQAIFFDEVTYREYLQLLYEGIRKYSVKVHAFVLMPNHVHLLMQPMREKALSAALQLIGSSYAKYINRRHERSGHLFQGRFHSSHVAQDAYLLVASRYIHNNPVRAGIVEDAQTYPWSSVRAYAGRLDFSSSLDRLIGRVVDPTLTLSLFGGGTQDSHVAYQKFLNSVSDTGKL